MMIRLPGTRPTGGWLGCLRLFYRGILRDGTDMVRPHDFIVLVLDDVAVPYVETW